MKCTSVAILFRNSSSLGKYYCWNATRVHSLELEDAFTFSKEALGTVLDLPLGEGICLFCTATAESINWLIFSQTIHYISLHAFYVSVLLPQCLAKYFLAAGWHLWKRGGALAVALLPKNESKVKIKRENNCHHNYNQTADCISVFPPEALEWGNKMHVFQQNNYVIMRLP